MSSHLPAACAPVNRRETKRSQNPPRISSLNAPTTLTMWEHSVGDRRNEDKSQQHRAIRLHSFSDLCHTSPPVFVFLLKECYVHGTLKATPKFKVLQQQVSFSLLNSPKVKPDIFIVHCLYLLPLCGPTYTEGLSHLLLSCLRRVQAIQKAQSITPEARILAAKLFLNALSGHVNHDDRILVKLLETFHVELEDIANISHGSREDAHGLDMAKSCIERFIIGFIESQSYMVAVSLLEQFSIRQSEEGFLYRMIEDHQFKAAEKWATFIGRPMLYLLVQKYLDMKMLKSAYVIIKKNDLKDEFPNAYFLYKERSIKKLVEKGCWDVAEIKANSDGKLLEYLVYLAMEAGYTEKVDEICERYSLSGFKKLADGAVTEGHLSNSRFLLSTELISEGILWTDSVDGILNATTYIEGCKFVGLDCEWKPNYEKGGKENRVSIMQIASESRVYIFDLIKLYADAPFVLNTCLKRILHSSKILKLGYNFHCDIQQLSRTYGELECFKYYEMLLDIQHLFKETRGGLSGLAKKVLGAGLDKTRRNSNWEQRPLSSNQMEYAALDAAVLVRIFSHVSCQSEMPDTKEQDPAKVEWKSHIASRMGKLRVAETSS